MSPAARSARAVAVAFVGAGFAFASWASRIPQVRDRLGLTAGSLGLVLLALAAGSVAALPLAGPLVARLGPRAVVRATAVVVAAALVVIGIGQDHGVAPVVVGLLAFGVAQGLWDVAMNVEGADAERRLGRAVMPRFHAGFSAGTVLGAATGAAAVALGVPVAAHLAVAGALTAAVVVPAVAAFAPPEPPAAEHAAGASAWAAWREPRTLLVGVLVLAFAFSEGTANDWTGVALVDGYGAGSAVAALGFAAFLAAMTASRWVGTALLDRFGRVPVLRATSALAVVGVLLVVLGAGLPLAFAGALLWGCGVSLGFPVGMSAAADEPARAAARVGVVSSVGYCAFLGGPPLVGLLADRAGVLRALLAVAVALAVGAALTPVLRPGERA